MVSDDYPKIAKSPLIPDYSFSGTRPTPQHPRGRVRVSHPSLGSSIVFSSPAPDRSFSLFTLGGQLLSRSRVISSRPTPLTLGVTIRVKSEGEGRSLVNQIRALQINTMTPLGNPNVVLLHSYNLVSLLFMFKNIQGVP